MPATATPVAPAPMLTYLRIGDTGTVPATAVGLRSGCTRWTWTSCCTTVFTGTVTAGGIGAAAGGFDGVEEAAGGFDGVGREAVPDTGVSFATAGTSTRTFSACTSTRSFAPSAGTRTVFCHLSYPDARTMMICSPPSTGSGRFHSDGSSDVPLRVTTRPRIRLWSETATVR